MTENVRSIEFTIRDKLLTEGSRIVSSEIKDGVAKLVFEVGKVEKTVANVNEEVFALVPASKLSLTDAFMNHEPQSAQEKTFKDLLTEVIKAGVSDFYRPKIDPSLDPKGNIYYQAGARPAIGQHYTWWEDKAKAFLPERKSRLGTKSEYVAFIGVLMKKLVESGWEVATAWYAICNDSIKLGYYWQSEGARYDFEPTGSREVCDYFDLANTYKMLKAEEKKGGYWLASGRRNSSTPLANLYHMHIFYTYSSSVGWLVLEK